ncbi:MAG: M60 family metallopeptidase [Kiritimatiellia bacterium]
MNRPLCAILFAGLLAPVLQAAPATLPKELAEGVRAINCDGLPGTVLVLSDEAFPIARAKNWDGTATFAAAGVTYGKGRAIYLGHPSFLTSGKLSDETLAFHSNAIRWLVRNKPAPQIGVYRNAAIRNALKRAGIESTLITDTADFPRYDLIASVDFTVQNAPAYLDFVRNGGGLLGAGLGWGWKQIASRTRAVSFADDFGDNRIFGPMGILMGDIGIVRPDKQGFPLDPQTVPNGTRADDALQIAAKDTYSSREQKRQVAVVLSQMAAVLPPSLPQGVLEKIAVFAKHPDAAKVPSPEHPVEPEDIFARLAILARKAAYETDRFRHWPADPAAEVYPGLVKPGTPTISREIEIDAAVPRWHSTGLFAPAGSRIAFTFPDGAADWNLRIRIGTTQDDLSGAAKGWKRFPLVTTEAPVLQSRVELTSPFGGLVYIIVPDQPPAADKRFTVRIDGAVMAPWFKLGRDTAEGFFEECRQTGAPQGEVEGLNYIITFETTGLAQCKDPEWVAAYWDRYLDACQWLSGLPPRRFPERLCSDIQLQGIGVLHDGYPMMALVNRRNPSAVILDRQALERAQAWGVYHEIGHNHQNPAWTPEGTSEVTVNLFTLLGISKVSGRSFRENGFATARAVADAKVRQWVASGKRFENWKKDPFLALEFYARLVETYGWDVLARVFAVYRKPGFALPRTNGDKWNVFAREFSAAVKQDVAAVMRQWSLPVSDAVARHCSQYAKAPDGLVRGLVREPYKPLATTPVKGLYMGICLTGADEGKIELYPTRESVPEGEKSERWKGDWLLLRRIEPTPGEVSLGNPQLSSGADARHGVTLTRPYYIGVYEVTQRQWFHIMGAWRGDTFGHPEVRGSLPVNGIPYCHTRGHVSDGICWPFSGYEVMPDSFFGRLRELTGFRADFDLPTEAQWEWACRAGGEGPWGTGEAAAPYQVKDAKPPMSVKRDRVLDTLGRYSGNCGGVACPAAVGSYRPNLWGLYDMHGNLFEHCLDFHNTAESLVDCSGTDPVGPRDESRSYKGRRVMKGGSVLCYGDPGSCAAWGRRLGSKTAPVIGHGATGFRVCVSDCVAPQSQIAPWAEPLTAEQLAARAELTAGTRYFRVNGLAGSVYCTGKGAFPLFAARNWDRSAACMASAGGAGKGRVVYVADDSGALELPENKVLREQIVRWLSANGRFRKVDGSLLKDGEASELVDFVRGGGGLLVTGTAWRWWMGALRSRGEASAIDWPGNVLLKEFGILGGRFCVRRTAPEGFSTRTMCSLGSAVPPPELYERQRFERANGLAASPARAGERGIRVKAGETIAFLGDSITRLGGGDRGYIALVLAGLDAVGVKDVQAVRAGCDGQNAGDMLGRVGGILANPEVKVLTVSCGVNDIWGYDWGRGVELEAYEQNVREIYDKAARAGVLVVPLTPTLIQENPDNDENRQLDLFADFIRAEAKRRGLPYADCRRAEVEALEKLPKTGERHFTYDGVHPVAAGHRLIAREVLKALGVPESSMPAVEKAWDRLLGD